MDYEKPTPTFFNLFFNTKYTKTAHMKYSYLTLFLLVMFAGCSKSSGDSVVTTPITPVTPVTTVPSTPSNATTNSTQAVWLLTNMSVNSIPRPLTSQQAAFRMVLSTDSKYSDTDGVLGNWSSPATDSLLIMQTNIPTMINLRYKIAAKSSSKLSLITGSGVSQINLEYEAR